jgi:hypothetical protein
VYEDRWLRYAAHDELGVGTDITALLARNELAAMWIGGVVAYSEAFHFIHVGVSRASSRTFKGGPVFGLRFADGRQEMHDGIMFRRVPATDISPGLLWPLRGHFDATRWFHLWSVHPLPPRGPLTILSAWPEEGIAETAITIDAGPILDAASRARPIWRSRSARRP